jgi:hypothetical protein
MFVFNSQFQLTVEHSREWCVQVIENPERFEPQEGNRYRFWGRVPELGNRYLRVVTLEDKLTIHNAFPDRGFEP